MTTSLEHPPLVRAIPARDVKALTRELARAKQHFGLGATASVRSSYEAGRDGFWLHRCLVNRGIVHQIVDSSSIEVNRRRRRTKTDRHGGGNYITQGDLDRSYIAEPVGLSEQSNRLSGNRTTAPATPA